MKKKKNLQNGNVSNTQKKQKKKEKKKREEEALEVYLNGFLLFRRRR